jgi:cell division protease FtsH
MKQCFKNLGITYLFFTIFSASTITFCDQDIAAPNIDTVFIDEQEFGTIANSEPAKPVMTSNDADTIEQEDETTQEEKLEKLLAQAEENEKCELLLKEVLKNYDNIDFALEHMALVINNNQVRKLTSKKPISEEIMKLRSIITMIKDGAFVVIKKDNLVQLIELAQTFIAHIRYVLTTDLVNFKTFDFEAAVTPNRLKLPKTYGFEQLEKMIQQNSGLLTKLESESENIGLNSFHKIYRRLEKINHDYKVLHRLTIAAGIGLGLAWFDYLTSRYISLRAEALWNKALDYLGFDKKENVQAKNSEKDSIIAGTQENTENSSAQESNIPDNDFIKKFGKKENEINVDNNNPILNQNNIQSLFSLGEQIGRGMFKGQMDAERELREQQAQSQKEHSQDKSLLRTFIMAAKDFLGSKVPDTKRGINDVPEAQRGWFTYWHNFLEKDLKLVSFAFTPFALFDYFTPTFKEWGQKGYAWTSTKLAQISAFLRGGPMKKQMDMWAEKEIRITFDDVIGNEHAKETLMRIVSYLVDYEKFDRAGIMPETGILLVGPPRTGKTYIAEALAGTIKMLLQEKGSNETIRLLSFTTAELKQYGISTVLLGAKALAPVVLFIDEIDTGRFQREGDATGLGELQVAMSTLNRDKSKKVIILAATNKPENLDYALLEPGRFGKHIDFTYPTFSERKEYLNRELQKRSVHISEEYINKLAHESENCSYDALNEVIVTALQKAKVRGSVLTWEDLDSAFDEEINKIILDEHTIPEAEQYVIAAHQAGHAYMRILRNASLQLTKVTIRPTSAKINEQAVISKYFEKNDSGKNQKESKTIEYGKVFVAHNSNSLKFETSNDLVDELIISLAGHVAEKILFDSSSYSYHNHDNEHALAIAKHIVFGGMPEKGMPKAIKEQKLTEAYNLVQKYEQEVTDLLTAHKKELIVITNILFEQKTLLAGEILQILELLEKKKNESEDKPAIDDQVVDEASNELPTQAVAAA